MYRYGGLIDLRIIMQFAYLTYDRRHNTVFEASLPCYPNTLSLHSVISFLFLISVIVSFPCGSTAASSKCQLCRSTLHLPDFPCKEFNQVPFHFYILSALPFGNSSTSWKDTYLYIQSSSHHLSQYFSFDIHLELAHPETTQSSKSNPHTGKVMALLRFSRPFWQGSFQGELGRPGSGTLCGRHLGCGCAWFRLLEIRRFGKSSTPKVSLILIHLKVQSLLLDECSTC